MVNVWRTTRFINTIIVVLREETFYFSIHVKALEMSNEHWGWHVLVEVYTERPSESRRKNWRTLEQNNRCKDTLVVTNRECKTGSSDERIGLAKNDWQKNQSKFAYRFNSKNITHSQTFYNIVKRNWIIILKECVQ